MINHKFASFSIFQIYDLSYIHLPYRNIVGHNMLFDNTVATRCDMLGVVGSNLKMVTGIWANNTQHVATSPNRATKRAQYIAPNNIAICCVDMLRSFGRGFRLEFYVEMHSSLNLRFDEMTMNLVFLASKGIQESYFLLFKLQKALWKASPWTELSHDISATLTVKFCGYVFANPDICTLIIKHASRVCHSKQV